jgi:uncharacterized membrane protein
MTSHHFGVRLVVIGIVLPIVIAIVGIAMMIAWIPDLPTPVATHWGGPGVPDGFGNAISYPVLLGLTVLPFTSIIGGLLALTSEGRSVNVMVKFFAVLTPWFSLMLTGILAGSLAGQRGLATAVDAPNPGWIVGASAGAATVIAALLWFVLPKAAPFDRTAGVTTVQPLDLAQGERAVWVRSASTPRWFALVFVGLGVILFGAVGLGVATSGGRSWPTLIIPVVVMFLLVGTFAWTVRVDHRGLLVRGVFGVPSFRVALADVASAQVIDVQAVMDFGGWGVRFGLGRRLGIILRSGHALEVRRTNGRAIVVTVDDAASAAALLEALVRREQGSSAVS